MPEPTYYAKLLFNELEKRGIKCKLEYHDGHKHVDIYIPEVNLEIEVDGSHHDKEPLQAFTDLLRTKYSLEDNRKTIRLPNSLVYNYPERTADVIKELVINLRKEPKKKISKQKTISESIPEEKKKRFEVRLKREFNLKKTKKKKRGVMIIGIIVISLICLGLIIWDNYLNIDKTSNIQDKPPQNELSKFSQEFYQEIELGMTALEFHQLVHGTLYSIYPNYWEKDYANLGLPGDASRIKVYFDNPLYVADKEIEGRYSPNVNATLIKKELYLGQELLITRP